MSEKTLQPEVIVFAGPNGSGKSTITRLAKTVGVYINADDIKKANHCSDLEAAQTAEKMRNAAVEEQADFTFETVLSTERNIKLLRKAKEKGYFVRCFYVLTADPNINVARVSIREKGGGHGVPEDKIRNRYGKSLRLIPEIVEICDIMHIYDNTIEPTRIFKKRKTKYFCWENEFWSRESIMKLTGIEKMDEAAL